MLTFVVEPAEREAWMEVEGRTWSRYLETCAGFVRKELWVDDARPGEVHAVIWWASQEEWDAVPASEVARIDADMGPWFRDCTMTRYQVVRTW